MHFYKISLVLNCFSKSHKKVFTKLNLKKIVSVKIVLIIKSRITTKTHWRISIRHVCDKWIESTNNLLLFIIRNFLNFKCFKFLRSAENFRRFICLSTLMENTCIGSICKTRSTCISCALHSSIVLLFNYFYLELVLNLEKKMFGPS